MSKGKVIESNVSNLIALCHIFNEYDKFDKKLISLASPKYRMNVLHELYKISNGERVIGSRKVKKFYQNYKSIIDKINEYSSIYDFVLYDENLDFFCKYIENHQDELDKILNLLENIKKLGFDLLQFDEEIDFTNDEYEIDTRIGGNFFGISYLDNMEVVPNYQDDVVLYRTTGSNYKIIVKVSFGDISGNKIVVNSLLFDPERLPKYITKEFIFDKIVNLKSNLKEDCDTIKNSVDLSIGVDDFYSQFNATSKIIEGLNDVESKEQAQKVLLGIKAYLEQLRTISSEYDDSVLKNSSILTKEKLHEEKQEYLKRRYYSSIDID